MFHESPALHPPQELLSALQATNQYARELGGVHLRELSPHERRSHFFRAIGHTATVISSRMLESPRSIKERLDAYQIRLLGAIDPFVGATLELDELQRSRHADKKRTRELKVPIIRFNHTLKDMIETHPDVKQAEILAFVKNAQLQMGNGHLAVVAEHKAREVMIGMQHELGAEQILWNVEGVSDVISRVEQEPDESDAEYEERCIDDEIHGTDLWVRYNDEWFRVDVKANPMNAAQRNQQHRVHGNDGNIALWSQLTLEDFNGKFRIDEKLAQRKAPVMEKELKRALAYEPSAYQQRYTTG